MIGGKETNDYTSDNLDIENGTDTSFTSSPEGPLLHRSIKKGKSGDSLNYLMQPFAMINESKDSLQKLGTVHIVKKHMVFSDPEFERRFTESLEANVRSRMLLLGIGAVGYGMYSMFLYNFLGQSHKRYPLIFSWHTSANVLHNLGWLLVVLMAFFMIYVSWKKTVFRRSVEQFLQYSALVMLLVIVLFGNLWRVSKITGVKFFDAFSGITDMYPDADLVMLLGSVVLYLAVVIDMRFRRLIWICMATFLIYTFTVIYMKLPDFRNLQLSTQTANAPAPYLSEEGRQMAVIRGLFSAATRERFVMDSSGATTINNDVPVMQGELQGWMMAIQLLLLYLIGLFGKVQLELLQRRTFLDLELAQKRIEVLEKTISAIDGNSSQPHAHLEKTQRRLKEAEKIVEKVRLVNMASTSEYSELETVVRVLRETNKTMTILEFQKEVLIGPMRTGVEYNEMEVLQWLKSALLLSTTAVQQHHDDAGEGKNMVIVPIIPLMRDASADLGISAKSLMKRIGVEWALNLGELEDTLRSNNSSDMNAFCLTAQAVLTPFLKNVLLGSPPEVLTGFIRALNYAYLDLPYHNADLAAYVCHHSTILLDLTGVRQAVGGLDRLALAVASLCHCVSHFGRSNAFLVETRHELALRYNDESVMENFHASKTFEIIRSSKITDITASLSNRDEKRFRSRVVQLILSGDTANHLSFFSELRSRLELASNGNKLLFLDPDCLEADKSTGLTACYKTALYGTFAMPTDVSLSWINRMGEEIAQQIQDENAFGLAVSPDWSSMTRGLLDLVIMPLFDEMFFLVKIHNPGPSEVAMGTICSALVTNHAYWTKNHRNNQNEMDIFIPIPKERTVTASSGSISRETTPNSPPALVPVDKPPDQPNSESSPISRKLESILSGSDDESDDEGPPMLPFNAVHQRR